MTGVGAITFLFTRELVGLIAAPIYRCILPKSGDETEWKSKIDKCVLHTAVLVNLSITTLWGYHTLHKSTWLPSYLGGQNPKADIKFAF